LLASVVALSLVFCASCGTTPARHASSPAHRLSSVNTKPTLGSGTSSSKSSTNSPTTALESTTSTSQIQSAAPSTIAPSCAMVTATQLAKDLNEQVTGPVSSTHSQAVLCTFSPTGTNAKSQAETSVEFQSGITSATFSSEQSQASKNNKLTPVSGLGQGAFSFTVSTSTAPFTILYFLFNSIQVGISSPSPLSGEVTLAGQLLRSLQPG